MYSTSSMRGCDGGAVGSSSSRVLTAQQLAEIPQRLRLERERALLLIVFICINYSLCCYCCCCYCISIAVQCVKEPNNQPSMAFIVAVVACVCSRVSQPFIQHLYIVAVMDADWLDPQCQHIVPRPLRSTWCTIDRTTFVAKCYRRTIENRLSKYVTTKISN